MNACSSWHGHHDFATIVLGFCHNTYPRMSIVTTSIIHMKIKQFGVEPGMFPSSLIFSWPLCYLKETSSLLAQYHTILELKVVIVVTQVKR
jgi:hypothetical protein